MIRKRFRSFHIILGIGKVNQIHTQKLLEIENGDVTSVREVSLSDNLSTLSLTESTSTHNIRKRVPRFLVIAKLLPRFPICKLSQVTFISELLDGAPPAPR